MQANSCSKSVLEKWTTAYGFPGSTSLTLRLLEKVINVDIVIEKLLSCVIL